MSLSALGPVEEVAVACLSLFSIKTQFPDEKRGGFLKGMLSRAMASIIAPSPASSV